VWDSTQGLAIDKGTRLEEEEMDHGNDSQYGEGLGTKTTQLAEMLGPTFRARTDIQPSMRFAKDVTVPTDCWVNFVVSYAMLVWYII
jgi:hypothetical protein